MGKHVRVWPLVWLVAVFMLCALLFQSAVYADDDDDDKDEARIHRGFKIARKAGLTLNLHGKNKALVGLGSYIVNAQGVCNNCHTHPAYVPDKPGMPGSGGNPFLNEPEQINIEQYMAGGRTFAMGTITADNITPDADGKPAGFTFKEFLETMRTGHNPQDNDPPGAPPLQFMSWPIFGKMTKQDLRAIYEYLRAIPPLPDNPNPGPSTGNGD